MEFIERAPVSLSLTSWSWALARQTFVSTGRVWESPEGPLRVPYGAVQCDGSTPRDQWEFDVERRSVVEETLRKGLRTRTPAGDQVEVRRGGAVRRVLS